MTWKGVHPIIHENHTPYQTGISLSKAAMRPVEQRLGVIIGRMGGAMA